MAKLSHSMLEQNLSEGYPDDEGKDERAPVAWRVEFNSELGETSGCCVYSPA